jgi:hypothetical protein
MNFVIPPRSQVGHPDREILSEGQSVELSSGDEVRVDWPLVKSAFPDISDVKSVKKYFHRVGFTPFPCWLYHPEQSPKMVMSQDEALEFGVVYRKCSPDEQARYGRSAMYDWQDDSKWRPAPFPKDVKFNPHKEHAGKNIVWPEKGGAIAQDALIEKLIPQVAASVAAALKLANPAAPANVSSNDWAAFQEFMAYKKAQEATREAVADVIEDNAPADEKAPWIAEAERLGVKIDKRWGLDKIKAEVEKAAA